MGNPPFLVMLTCGSWDIHRKLQGFSHPPYQAAVASGLATLAGQKKPQAVAAIGAMAVASKLRSFGWSKYMSIHQPHKKW